MLRRPLGHAWLAAAIVLAAAPAAAFPTGEEVDALKASDDATEKALAAEHDKLAARSWLTPAGRAELARWQARPGADVVPAGAADELRRGLADKRFVRRAAAAQLVGELAEAAYVDRKLAGLARRAWLRRLDAGLRAGKPDSTAGIGAFIVALGRFHDPAGLPTLKWVRHEADAAAVDTEPPASSLFARCMPGYMLNIDVGSDYRGRADLAIANAGMGPAPPPAFRTPPGLSAVAAGPDGQPWVLTEEGKALAKLSMAGQAVARATLPGPAAAIAVDAKNGLWAALRDGRLIKADPKGAILATIPAGRELRGVAVSDDGTVWVTDRDGNQVNGFTPAGQRIGGGVPVGGQPGAISFMASMTTCAVANEGAATVSLISEGKVTATFAVGRRPAGVAIDPWSRVWVTCQDDDTATCYVHEFRDGVEGWFPVITARTGRGPTAIEARMDGTWIVNAGDGTVTRLAPWYGTPLYTYPVGARPVGLAFARGRAWVASAGSGTLARIPAKP